VRLLRRAHRGPSRPAEPSSPHSAAGHPDQLLPIPITYRMRHRSLIVGDHAEIPDLHDAAAAPRGEAGRGTAGKPATCGTPAGPNRTLALPAQFNILPSTDKCPPEFVLNR
jgi:hypothetical protein